MQFSKTKKKRNIFVLYRGSCLAACRGYTKSADNQPMKDGYKKISRYTKPPKIQYLLSIVARRCSKTGEIRGISVLSFCARNIACLSTIFCESRNNSDTAFPPTAEATPGMDFVVRRGIRCKVPEGGFGSEEKALLLRSKLPSTKRL